MDRRQSDEELLSILLQNVNPEATVFPINSKISLLDTNNPIDNAMEESPKIDLTLISAVVQLFGVVLAVMYSSDVYDVWDVGLALFVLYIWSKYKRAFIGEDFSFHVALFGVAVSYMIILLTIITYTNYFFVSRFQQNFAKKVDTWLSTDPLSSFVEVGISIALFFALRFWESSKVTNLCQEHILSPK